MRKQNPNDVVQEFQGRLAGDLNRWRAGIADLKGDGLRNSAVDTFFRAATAFEGYRSDWHVAAINRDSSVLRARLVAVVDKALMGSRYPGLLKHVKEEVPTNPSLQVIRDLVDPQGANVSFGSRWVERSRDELFGSYADKVALLAAADHAFVRTLVALRNFIAHRSVRASNEFDEARFSLAAADNDLRGGSRRIHPSGIGSYLNARRMGTARVELYIARLNDIAQSMWV